MHEHSEKLEYVTDWLDDYKMLWTDNPEYKINNNK